jgi:hypothetical protein
VITWHRLHAAPAAVVIELPRLVLGAARTICAPRSAVDRRGIGVVVDGFGAVERVKYPLPPIRDAALDAQPP